MQVNSCLSFLHSLPPFPGTVHSNLPPGGLAPPAAMSGHIGGSVECRELTMGWYGGGGRAQDQTTLALHIIYKHRNQALLLRVIGSRTVLMQC